MKDEHIVTSMLDVDIPGKRRRGRPNLRWKDACKRDMTQAGSVERGQCNKQGRMEKQANQLYLRPQMTGQARDEEEEDDDRAIIQLICDKYSTMCMPQTIYRI